MKRFPLCLALAILPMVAGPMLARHLTHTVARLAAAGGDGTAAKRPPAEAIEGTWLRLAVQNSVPQLEEDWRFEGGKLVFLQHRAVRSPEELKRWGKATYKLDPARTPHAMDLTMEDGKKVRGIYLLADDVLVVCLSKPGAARPRKFAANPDEGQELLQFQRQAAKARKPAR